MKAIKMGMWDCLINQIIGLYRDVPNVLYIALIFVFVICAIVTFNKNGLKNKKGVIGKILLGEYVALLYCSTVLYRTAGKERGYRLQPFWSYTTPSDIRVYMIADNIMNVFAFIPVGIFLGVAIRSLKWYQAIIVSALISISIEVMQYTLNRGLSEFDDVMHNTAGALLGYGLFLVGKKIYDGISKKRVEV